jgi:hypothetical protein
MTDPEKIPFLNPIPHATFSHPHHTPAPQHSHNVHVTSDDPHVNIIVKENAKLKQDIDNLRTQLSEVIKPVETVYPVIYRPATEDSEKVKAAAEKKYPKIAHPISGPVRPGHPATTVSPGGVLKSEALIPTVKSQLTQQMEQNKQAQQGQLQSRPKITLTPKVPHDSSING